MVPEEMEVTLAIGAIRDRVLEDAVIPRVRVPCGLMRRTLLRFSKH